MLFLPCSVTTTIDSVRLGVSDIDPRQFTSQHLRGTKHGKQTSIKEHNS